MTTIPNTIVRTGAPSYGRCPRELLRDKSISTRAKVLYVILDDYADKDGKAFPSRATLSDSLGCSTDSVDRAVSELATSGWLTKEVRRKDDKSYKSTLYTLVWDRERVAASVRPPSRMGADTLAAPMPTEEEPPEAESPKEEPSLTADAASRTDLDQTFDEFWEVYPRKVGKRAAQKCWPAAVARVIKSSKSHIEYDVRGAGNWIRANAAEMAADRNLPPKDLIPHPATWLNRDGWDDEPYPPRSGNAPIRTAGESYTGEGRVMTADEWDQSERTAAHG